MDKTRVILIADPNPFVRSFLSRELRAAGYHTVEAGAGREILKHLDGEFPPALVVLELDFPIIIGMNVLQWIQQRVPRIPQIIYTHLTEYETHSDVMNADAFVEKNDDPDELFRAIQTVLEGHYAYRLQK